MRKAIFFIIVVFSSVVLYAQADNELNKFDELNKNQILFTPRFIDFVNPGIEINYERLYGDNKFSTLLSVTYLNDILNISIYEAFSGIRVGLEEKYFFTRQAEMGAFIAGELVYYKSKIKLIHHFNENISNDPDVSYIDTFSIKKSMAFFNLKSGIQIIVNPLIFEMNIGLGIKYQNINHFDKIRPGESMKGYNDFNPYSVALDEFKGFTLNVPINLKLGFTF